MKRILTPFLFLVVFISCEDDEPSDLRDLSTGAYDYRMKLYVVTGNTLTYWSADDKTGTLIVQKTSAGLKFIEGGHIVFEGNKIAQAANGFSFDIPSQDFEINGVPYTIEGYDGIELGSVKYHAAYFSDTKQIKAYFFIENTGVASDFVIEYLSTKK